MKSPRVSFTVSLDLPEGVSVEGMADYIDDAICTLIGCKDPLNDPLCDLDRGSVTVKPLKRVSK